MTIVAVGGFGTAPSARGLNGITSVVQQWQPCRAMRRCVHPPSPHSPYRFADHPAPSVPACITWYRVYTAAMALLYVVVAGVAGFLAFSEVAGGAPEVTFVGWLFLLLFPLLGIALAGFYVFATFVPRRPWGWVVAMVAIAIGVTGGRVIVALPLLLAWMKPRAKHWFGRW